jgi:hypothetical protein
MAHMSKIVPAEGEQLGFAPGDRVSGGVRFPIGHYRAPRYIRGRTAVIEHVIEPPGRSRCSSCTPALGAKVVAHAWVDPAFRARRARLLENGRAA